MDIQATNLNINMLFYIIASFGSRSAKKVLIIFTMCIGTGMPHNNDFGKIIALCLLTGIQLPSTLSAKPHSG